MYSLTSATCRLAGNCEKTSSWVRTSRKNGAPRLQRHDVPHEHALEAAPGQPVRAERDGSADVVGNHQGRSSRQWSSSVANRDVCVAKPTAAYFSESP